MKRERDRVAFSCFFSTEMGTHELGRESSARIIIIISHYSALGQSADHCWSKSCPSLSLARAEAVLPLYI